MGYTVQKLAKLSGVSVRTLHYYDEIGLLRPAYTTANGYRYYEEKELLLLQQILFFRELGFELKKIQKILGKEGFDKVAALQAHRKVLQSNIQRTKELIKTIDKTVNHLSGEKKMKDQEMYQGFVTKEKQEEYVTYLKNRLGEDHYSFAECDAKTKKMSKEDMALAMKEGDAIFTALSESMQKGQTADSTEVQKAIYKLYNWVKQFWTPDKESFIGLGQMYTELEWKKFFGKFDPHHPRLAMFVAQGMKVFAERELGFE